MEKRLWFQDIQMRTAVYTKWVEERNSQPGPHITNDNTGASHSHFMGARETFTSNKTLQNFIEHTKVKFGSVAVKYP